LLALGRALEAVDDQPRIEHAGRYISQTEKPALRRPSAGHASTHGGSHRLDSSPHIG
jgi:hypothetical protein